MADMTSALLQVKPEDLVQLRNFLFVSVTIPLILFLIRRMYQDYKKQQERRRKLYAEAFAVCMEYKEFPFVIYRRGRKDPEAERLRISEALRDVQRRLAYHKAWLETESPRVARAYDKLVQRLKEVPGEEMKKAWRTSPIRRDEQMIIANRIDWQDLADFERDYIKAVNRELTPWWHFKKKYFS